MASMTEALLWASIVGWLTARSAQARWAEQAMPRAHLEATLVLAYACSAILLCVGVCFALDAFEALRPLHAVASAEWVRDDNMFAGPLAAADELANTAWLAVGLTYERLRIVACVATTASVTLHFVLSDRAHLIAPSPFRLAVLLLFEVQCVVLLGACVPIMTIRAGGRLLLGTPFLESVYACGLSSALTFRRAFARSVALRKEAAFASTYSEWWAARKALDEHEGRKAWQHASVSAHFDYKLVRRALESLARIRDEADESGSPHKLAEVLITLSNRSFANLNDPFNYEFAGASPPHPIAQLLDGVEAAIDHLLAHEWGPSFDIGAKRAFITMARHAHGVTALCLSGGGAIAMHHMGLILELLEHGLLPQLVSGTSGGAIIAGVLACHPDVELPQYLRKEVINIKDGARLFPTPLAMLKLLLTDGVIIDKDEFLSFLQALYGDLTFHEAYSRSGRLVSLTTSTAQLGESLMLNYLLAPTVLVRSAVQVSCALTGVMKPSTLLAKAPDGTIGPYESAGLLFRDGSFQSDVPVEQLRRFHATHFLVSQCNPHVTPLLTDTLRPRSPLDTLQRHLLTQVGVRLKMHRDAGRLPTELANLVQTYGGGPTDVTVHPPWRLGDLTIRVLSQPDEPRMADFIQRGRRMTWTHLPRLARQLQIERCLERAAANLADPDLVRSRRISWVDGAVSKRPSIVVDAGLFDSS